MTRQAAAPATLLSRHPALARMPAEVAAAFRVFYGRQLAPLVAGEQTFTVHFGEALALQAGLQLHARCAGHDFELQVVEPGVLMDTGLALTEGVPQALRRAALMQALQPLRQVLEQTLGVGIELFELNGQRRAWGPDEALGLHVTRRHHIGGPNQGPDRTDVLLRASQPQAWRWLAQAGATAELAHLPAAHDPRMALSVQCEPVDLTVQELAQLETGDVLLLDARADQLRELPVRLVLHGEPLPQTRALRAGHRVTISRVPVAHERPADPDRSNFRRRDMNDPDTTSAPALAHAARPRPAGGSPSLDAVVVDIELELGRLSLPVSALRSLAVGQVFETAQAVDGDGVVLWCGGQRLGLGQLVAIGDRLGVRIAALLAAPSAADAADGGSAATPAAADTAAEPAPVATS